MWKLSRGRVLLDEPPEEEDGLQGGPPPAAAAAAAQVRGRAGGGRAVEIAQVLRHAGMGAHR